MGAWVNANRKFLVAVVGAILSAVAAAVKKPLDETTTQAIVGGIVAIVVWAVPNVPAPPTQSTTKAVPPVLGVLLLTLVNGCALFTPKTVGSIVADIGCIIEHYGDPDAVLAKECNIAPDLVTQARQQAVKSVAAASQHPELARLAQTDGGAP